MNHGWTRYLRRIFCKAHYNCYEYDTISANLEAGQDKMSIAIDIDESCIATWERVTAVITAATAVRPYLYKSIVTSTRYSSHPSILHHGGCVSFTYVNTFIYCVTDLSPLESPLALGVSKSFKSSN
jgi:hypothetical protein